ncbi:glycoside hydrolase family 2 protein [Acinetobacter baumannii]|uniref:glycoside hydrolase family 2 protein n=1 Tax=Acinetobacter baumannii TaxID=470 RepID=UPI0034D2F01B
MQPDGPALRLSTDRFARFVTIDDDRLQAADQGFCLVPGESRLIQLAAGRVEAAPRGRVRALNSHSVAYGDAS